MFIQYSGRRQERVWVAQRPGAKNRRYRDLSRQQRPYVPHLNPRKWSGCSPGPRFRAHGSAGKEQCAPVLVKVRHGLTTSNLRRSKLIRNIESGRKNTADRVLPNLGDLPVNMDKIDAAIVFWPSGSGAPPVPRAARRCIEKMKIGAGSRTRLDSRARDAAAHRSQQM